MKSSLLYVPLLIIVCTSSKKRNNNALSTNSLSSINTNHVITSYGLPGLTGKRVDFSGNWILNESKSQTGTFGVGNKVCLDWLGAYKTMSIFRHAAFLVMDLAKPSSEQTPFIRHEKLSLDGKETQSNFLASLMKKSTVKWSADGQTMYVNAVIDYSGTIIKVSEIWRLTNNGKTIYLETVSKSKFGENNMKLV